MTQLAKVTSVLPSDMAEVSVARQSACANDCSECAGCEQLVPMPDMVVKAKNSAGARLGDIVMIESSNKTFFGTVLMVYIVPLILFFVGYFIANAICGGASEGIPILGAFAGVAVGLLLTIPLDRRLKKTNAVQFDIVEVKLRCLDT